MRRHAAAVGRFLYSSGAAPDEIEDLVQEALFRAFRRLDGWRGEASFRSWLFAIAGNVLRDEVRRRKGRQVLVARRSGPARSRRSRTPSWRRPKPRKVCAAGSRALPRLQREVFLLRAQQGAGYAEIAAALGTTPGAARVHYHHAVKRLKELVR